MTDQIRPAKFEPNLPITLAETQIIDIDGQREDIPVSVVFQLHPSPRVVFESDTLAELTRRERHKRIELRSGAKLEVVLGAPYFDPDRLILIPVSQPVSVIDKGSPLKEVSFAILNLPEFYGQQDKMISDAGQWVRIPHEILKTSDWSIDITGVRNIGEAVKTLRRTRGHGITYTGSITRSDGTTFFVRNVEPLLEALRFFLSIARGAACSLALVRGKDEMSQVSWVRWGAHNSEPWLDYHSAFPRGHNEILPDLFPEFWILFMDQENRKGSTLRALDWYLQSNVSAPYIGTILTLAALEGFAYLMLSRERKKGERTGEFIGSALSKLRIPLDLPKNCQELKSMKKWDTGPHTLVDIRNNLIHPRKDLGDVSNKAYLEAWELGQWYFELMLLSRLGHQGRYVNRLANICENEESIVLIPWAPG
ncbi:MAG: hypothetical protein OXF50_24340 [Caldilineaceae bacterium]|nr:hypothetical protein [Caldilineaceae bacterium]